jgi:hypothetical protein
MRHEAALRRLDELDAGEEPGLSLRMHLAGCADCAQAARRTEKALLAYRTAPASGASAEDLRLEDRIMEAVRLTQPPRQDFAIRDWLFPAAVILLSMCLLPLGSKVGILQSLFEPGSALSLSLVLGFAFTAYSVLFVVTHLRELVAFLAKRGVTLR